MKFVWHDGRWCEAIRAPRPRLFPAIIRDQMAPLQHPATGQVMDSKSAFRAATHAAGYEEIGTEVEAHLSPARPKPDPIAPDIAEAIEMLEQGFRPAPVESADEWGDVRMIETI